MALKLKSKQILKKADALMAQGGLPAKLLASTGAAYTSGILLAGIEKKNTRVLLCMATVGLGILGYTKSQSEVVAQIGLGSVWGGAYGLLVGGNPKEWKP